MNKENELGQKIKKLRKAMGLTQFRLAELADIDDKHLSKIENGVHLPTFKTLKRLSKILHCNLVDMNIVADDTCITNSPIYQKILKIINTATTNEELQYYYETLKLVHNIMKKI